MFRLIINIIFSLILVMGAKYSTLPITCIIVTDIVLMGFSFYNFYRIKRSKCSVVFIEDILRVWVLFIISIVIINFFKLPLKSANFQSFSIVGISVIYMFAIIFWYISRIPNIGVPRLYKIKDPIWIALSLYICILLLSIFGKINLGAITFFSSLLAVVYHICSKELWLLSDLSLKEYEENLAKTVYRLKLFLTSLLPIIFLSLSLFSLSNNPQDGEKLDKVVLLTRETVPKSYFQYLEIGEYRLIFIAVTVFMMLIGYMLLSFFYPLNTRFNKLISKWYSVDYDKGTKVFTEAFFEELIRNILTHETLQSYNKPFLTNKVIADIHRTVKKELEKKISSEYLYILEQVEVKEIYNTHSDKKYFRFKLLFYFPFQNNNKDVVFFCVVDEKINRGKLEYYLQF
ncbi:hypothetical protein JO388_08355 [Streptococcus suis]|uniref:hypothetical protein n=2 Tax=Streptococcus suis TaxID=1307 RepID=UPI000CF36A4C|nr:hypothetical protein [Streptococcus suis]MBM7180282.1 hypothetical protein [Streptococcus suis]MCL4882305.1 hypothetical protein [Streptococcus suis]